MRYSVRLPVKIPVSYPLNAWLKPADSQLRPASQSVLLVSTIYVSTHRQGFTKASNVSGSPETNSGGELSTAGDA